MRTKLIMLKSKLDEFKTQTLTVYFASRDPEMPLLTKMLAIFIAAYAFSPIDLIPDFIPIIGYLDDLIIIPLGLALVLHFTPQKIIVSARHKAERAMEKPTSFLMAIFIVFVWMLSAVAIAIYLK